ncbi:MAG: MurR/RpiR family transcriptional regulator [Coprobacillus sp.]
MKNQSIRLIIKSIYRDLSKKEKSIADFILENPKKVSRSTINEISNELSIADSTFFQFTRKLGYNGFRDFRNDLLTEEFDAEISVHENISHDDNALTMAKKAFESSIHALEDTKNLLDLDSLNKAANIILNTNNLVFFGIGGSNIIASDAYHKFLRSPVRCQHAEDFHIQLMQASLLTKDDCAFLISHTGLTKEAIQIAEVVKKNGTRLIVVTSFPLSPLAKMADVVFISSSEETGYRSESLSSRISQLSITDALFVIIMFSDEKKTSEALHKIRNVIYPTKEPN